MAQPSSEAGVEKEEEEEEELSLSDVEPDSRRDERLSLVDKDMHEFHSLRSCLKARSFLLALAVSFVVIVFVFVLVVGLIAGLVASQQSSDPANRKVISLDDVFNPNFQQKYYSASWSDDGRLLHSSNADGVTLFDPGTENTAVLIDAEKWKSLNDELQTVFDVKLSHDNNNLLLATNFEQVYRHSYLADYYIYSITNQSLSNLTLPDVTTRVQYAEWSPTDDVIVFVLADNIYLYDVEQDNVTMVTTGGGVAGTIYGIPDWLYEEEILATNHALWWSPDGQNILFASFDVVSEREFSFPKYGPFSDQYTDIESIKYPKPGTANPIAKLFVVDVTDPSFITPKNITAPANIDSDDNYFVFAGWSNKSVAMVTWMNRTQTEAVYCLYAVTSSSLLCDDVYTQQSSAWIELIQPPKFTNGGSKMLALVSKATDSGSDSFTHIVKIDTATGTEVFLTSGSWEVTSVLGVANDNVLYISTETQSWQRHVYSSNPKQCLTCSQDDWNIPKSLNPAIPDSCDYFSASCSNSLEHCLLNCLGPAIPYTILVKYTTGKFVEVKLFENNSVLREAIADLALPLVDTFTVPASSEGPALNGRVFFPPNFDPSTSYPALVYVYGGPNSQQVSNTSVLSSLSRLFLASNLNMFLISVDGRGTGFRGDNFKHAVYRQLGRYETVDQLRAGRYLPVKFSQIDASKLAIYGSSYGGYMAGQVGSSGGGVFKAAISQSPVSDWIYYDSAYTERYMGQPTAADNLQGYEESSLLSRAKNFSLVDYLLIHGTGDDNVHFQHSAQLVRALTEADVQFQLQIYTDKAHALAGTHTRRHLYTLIDDFLRESFQL